MLHGRLDIGLMFSFRNPAAWRRPFPDVYRDELGLITHAEELGYDTIWLTEHHFADDGYSPSIIPLAAAIAAQTERVRIGFNLLLLPLHNAIRVAEDIATLDVLSGGRIDVGLGQGYARHEFAGYGIDRGERLGRFREGLDVLQGLWTQRHVLLRRRALPDRRRPADARSRCSSRCRRCGSAPPAGPASAAPAGAAPTCSG